MWLGSLLLTVYITYLSTRSEEATIKIQRGEEDNALRIRMAVLEVRQTAVEDDISDIKADVKEILRRLPK
jgi:hypothetical protein